MTCQTRDFIIHSSPFQPPELKPILFSYHLLLYAMAGELGNVAVVMGAELIRQTIKLSWMKNSK